MKAEEGCDISHQQSQRYIRGYCVKVRMKKRKSVYKKGNNNQAKLLTHWEEDCFAISAAQHRSSSSSSTNNNNNNNEVVQKTENYIWSTIPVPHHFHLLRSGTLLLHLFFLPISQQAHNSS